MVKKTITWSTCGGIPLDVAYSVFGLIMQHTNLILLRVNDGSEDIQLSIVPKSHEHYTGDNTVLCPTPFSPNTLAHVRRPNGASFGRPIVVHLNMEKIWSLGRLKLPPNKIGVEKSYSLFITLLHGVLHALGLEHNKDRNSVLYDSYNYTLSGNWTSNGFNLPDIDVKSLRSLYGPPTSRFDPISQ